MKSAKLLIAFVLTSLVLLAPAAAQTMPVRVTVPFDFTIGHQRMPAGVYRVTIQHDLELQVVRMDKSSVANVLTTYIGRGSNQDLTPKLVFYRYGDHRYLAEVWMGDWEVGHQLFTSAEELQFARTLKSEPTTIVATRLPN